jgi:ATP-dependent Clp protease, protease subunit
MKSRNRSIQAAVRAAIQSMSKTDISSISSGAFIPTVIEDSPNGERGMDIYSRLLKENIIVLSGPIDDQKAELIKAQMLFLGRADEKNEIKLYIDSPGGSVYAGLGILGVMETVPNVIMTINAGLCASMAAVLLCAGNKRRAYRYSTTMIHQPLMNNAGGQATDIEINANEIKRLKDLLYEIMAEKTGQDKEKIYGDCERDHYLTAQQAKDYGLIDDILQPVKKIIVAPQSKN